MSLQHLCLERERRLQAAMVEQRRPEHHGPTPICQSWDDPSGIERIERSHKADARVSRSVSASAFRLRIVCMQSVSPIRPRTCSDCSDTLSISCLQSNTRLSFSLSLSVSQGFECTMIARVCADMVCVSIGARLHNRGLRHAQGRDAACVGPRV